MNVSVNKKASAYAQDEIFIKAPVEKVYNVVATINNWPSWQKSVKKSLMKSSVREGMEFTWQVNGMTIRSRLHTVKPSSEFGWTGKIWWISAVHNWYFHPMINGTKVIVQESLKGFGSSWMKGSLVKGMRQNLIELKAKAESIK